MLHETISLEPGEERSRQSREGYLKQLGALLRVRGNLDWISLETVLKEAVAMVEHVHDPLTWHIDVERRVNSRASIPVRCEFPVWSFHHCS